LLHVFTLNRLHSKLFSEAKVVITTLSNAGRGSFSTLLNHAVERKGNNYTLGFIDEAAMSTEPECLIAVKLLTGNVNGYRLRKLVG
jgi:superfamily I DNA and/or RNA helicase